MRLLSPALLQSGLVALSVFAIGGCSCSSNDSSGSGGSAGTAGTAGSAGAGGSSGGAAGSAGMGGSAGTAGSGGTPQYTTERWGARLWGNPLALSRVDRELWIGTRGNADPSADEAADLRGGLVRLDLDTGEVRVFESELPQVPDPFEPTRQTPVSTRGVIADGQKRLVASESGILVIDGSNVQVIAVGGGATSARVTDLALDRGGNRNALWAGTDQGLVEYDADTMQPRRTLAESELGAASVGDLALDPDSGEIYAAVYGDSDSWVAHVGSSVDTWTPGSNGLPDGTVGDIVFAEGQAYIALASWAADDGGIVSWDGTTAESFVLEGELSWAADGTSRAFGAWELDYVPASKTLIVGGRLSPNGGGGLAYVDLTAQNPARGIGVTQGPAGLPGDHVGALAFDPTTGRTFVSLSMLCNESKLGAMGVFGLAFDQGDIHIERPLLSGVRDVVSRGNEVLMALRDENPGYSCEGLPVTRGVLRLLKNRGGEYVIGRYQRDDSSGIDFNPAWFAPSLLADGPELAYTGNKEGLFVGFPDSTNYNQAISFATSLYVNDLRWDGDTLWLSGNASTDNTPEVNDRSPRGTVRVSFDTNSKLAFQHYARSQGNDSETIVGLPSNDVSAVIPAGNGDAYALCAAERASDSRDRVQGEIYNPGSGEQLGGIAKITGADVSVVADAKTAPDPRAGVITEDGVLYVADARVGLIRVSNGNVDTSPWPSEVPTGSVPQAMRLGPTGERLVSFDTGLLILTDSLAFFFGGNAYTWRGATLSAGALVGTDEGLLLVGAPELPSGLGADPVQSALPAFRDLEKPSTGGQCTASGQKCGGTGDLPCCPGLTCISGIAGFTCN
ncbi:MAG: hypothetical protein R3B07_21050 [Polyangiaceae bacterium]